MKHHYFVSVICPFKNASDNLKKEVLEIGHCLRQSVDDYEIILLDNASTDNSNHILRELTKENGEPNIQVFTLTKEVAFDTAAWAGLANCLGDLAIVYDIQKDQIEIVDELINQASQGNEVVFARITNKPKMPLFYSFAYNFYNFFLRHFAGIDLEKDVPSFRLLSRKVINYLLKFPNPEKQYRFLPAIAGFNKSNLEFSSLKNSRSPKAFTQSFEKGVALLISTTNAPMRIVTTLSLFGAIANFIYSIYVILTAILRHDVEPGWTTISLQQSGMFFLFSVVLFILGEYVLHMISTNSDGPSYHIGNEYMSHTIRRRETLNIEE